ncbi:MAG: hypothetical protein RI572_09940, partial [Salegentibacter sp.]|uniref:hypothetical protein n=1 Tax=Salegentibacter sp. TaxID=1903072 RepID=UPI00286FD6C1
FGVRERRKGEKGRIRGNRINGSRVNELSNPEYTNPESRTNESRINQSRFPITSSQGHNLKPDQYQLLLNFLLSVTSVTRI